jgi:DNA-binding winged helix-turn-helix (wHTH) protein/Tol biopolymer transport system component
VTLLIPPGILRFGVFEVNTAARELRKHGIRVRLAGQPFAILLMLLERPGDVIEREELRRRLWPEDTFVDFEHGLNSAVKKLRVALGDSARNARYVETLPRVGYRFIAPVQREDDSSLHAVPSSSQVAAAVESVASPALRPPPRASPWWRRAYVIAIGAPLAAVILFFAIPRRQISVVGISRLTTTSRVDPWGRLHTDAARIFFLERRGHRWDLMQMSAAGGPAEHFNEPFENTKVFDVSPDRSQMILGPFAVRGEFVPLWLMPLVGGVPMRLGDIVARDAVFTPDGTQITYSRDDEGISVVGREGGAPHRLIALAGAMGSLRWSPDGRVLRFEWARPGTAGDAIWEVDARGANLHQLLPWWDKVPEQCCGRWTSDGRYYIFVSRNHGGSQNMWALPEPPQWSIWSRPEPIPLNTAPITVDQPLPWSTRDRLFVLGWNAKNEYVTFEPATRQFHSALGGASAVWLTFGRDSRHVLYVSDNALWRSDPDGTGRREIVGAAYSPGAGRLSPDGTQAVFQGAPSDSQIDRLFVVSTDGGAPSEVASARYSLRLPDWSPDGKSIVYAVHEEAGPAAGLYVLDLRSGKSAKIEASEGFAQGAWSPDGKLLAGAENSRTAVFDPATRRWRDLARGRVFGPPIWSRDSRYLYVQDILEENEPVRRIEVMTGRIDDVVDFRSVLEGGVQRCGLEGIAPDGSLVVRLTRGDHDVYVVRLQVP